MQTALLRSCNCRKTKLLKEWPFGVVIRVFIFANGSC